MFKNCLVPGGGGESGGGRGEETWAGLGPRIQHFIKQPQVTLMKEIWDTAEDAWDYGLCI